MMFRKPLFAAALLTGVAILGLSPALAQNPLAQANPGTPATITRPLPGTIVERMPPSPLPVPPDTIVNPVPPSDSVTGQRKITSAWIDGTEWPRPRDVRCFSPQNCQGFARRMQ